MVGWLDDWMVGWLDGWMIGCLDGSNSPALTPMLNIPWRQCQSWGKLFPPRPCKEVSVTAAGDCCILLIVRGGRGTGGASLRSQHCPWAPLLSCFGHHTFSCGKVTAARRATLLSNPDGPRHRGDTDTETLTAGNYGLEQYDDMYVLPSYFHITVMHMKANQVGAGFIGGTLL